MEHAIRKRGNAMTLIRSALLAALAALLAAGCTSYNAVGDSRKAMQEGRSEDALLMLEKAASAPDNHVERQEYYRMRQVLTSQWLGQAETLRSAGELEAAEALYRRVQRYDPPNARARAGLAQLDADQRHRIIIASAEKLVRVDKFREAQDVLRPVLVENPDQRDAWRLQRLIDEKLAKPALAPLRMRPASTKPISLELRDVTVRSMFDVLQRATGVSFVFDKDVRSDQRSSLAVRDQELEDVVRLILMSNQLEQKIINETTVLIYPNTPQKLREYQELVVKAFYVANADVKQTANMIRTLVKTRDIFLDEKLNLIVLKDTPNAVRLAERLIATQDLAEPEVLLEVEVIEVGYNRLMELGLRYPSAVALSLVGGGTAAPTPSGGTAITGGTPGVLSLPEWIGRNANLVRLTFTDPLFILTLRQQDGSTNVLANPRIRVKNREKAKIHIGDRVPVITTTAAAAGGFVSESVSYLDVGLKLEVEPLIYLDDEVGIKVALEVSNITRTVQSASSSTLTYQIGTRNATTTLRLRDGETQILAGLISDEDRRTADRVPGLGDLPVLGRLFSSTSNNNTKTEVMLLITPRLMRQIARPGVNSVEFSAGTEASTGLAAGSGAPSFIPPVAPLVPPPPIPGTIQPPAPAGAPQPAPGAPQPYTGTQPGTPPVAPDMVPFGGQKPTVP
jgi:general secretion pathway protein D